ncbi:MAG: hypothetical protein ACYCPQ_03370, partial [Elusimicrobiota bacterium]
MTRFFKKIAAISLFAILFAPPFSSLAQAALEEVPAQERVSAPGMAMIPAQLPLEIGSALEDNLELPTEFGVAPALPQRAAASPSLRALPIARGEFKSRPVAQKALETIQTSEPSAELPITSAGPAQPLSLQSDKSVSVKSRP